MLGFDGRQPEGSIDGAGPAHNRSSSEPVRSTNAWTIPNSNRSTQWRWRAGNQPTHLVLQAVDAIRVVNLLSWRYRDPGLLLAAKIGAKRPATSYTGAGGNTPSRW